MQGLRRFVLIFGLAAASYWKGRLRAGSEIAMEVDLKLEVMTRLRKELRWDEAMPVRDLLMREARSLGLYSYDAQETTYAQLDVMFPSLRKDVHSALENHVEPRTPSEPRTNQGLGTDPASGADLAANGNEGMEGGDDLVGAIGTSSKVRKIP